MFSRQSQSAASNRVHCDLVTHRYMFTGDLDAGAGLLRLLTDAQRAGLRLINVTATLLDTASSSLSTFTQDELIVLRDYTVFIRAESAAILGPKHLAAEEEKLLVYTERFVLQGYFYSSSERNRLLDTDGPTGRWALARDVILHPLIPTSKGAPATAKFILLNKTAIQFFHPARA